MYTQINESYDTLEAAQRRSDSLRQVDPITEAYISGPFKMDEDLAQQMYGKRDIWTVSGEIFRG